MICVQGYPVYAFWQIDLCMMDKPLNSTRQLSFKPGVLPTLVSIALLVVLLKLGFWQLDRADEKQFLFDQVESQKDLPALNSLQQAPGDFSSLHWRKARLQARYLPQMTFLLDNQVRQGQAGYFVYSLIETEGGQMLLFNRGWIKANPDRRIVELPAIPDSPAFFSGVLKPPPATGWLLAENTDEKLADGLVRLQSVEPEALNKRYKLALLPLVLRQETGSGDGFIRDWPVPGSGKEKNLGYAFQWFAMALALIVIYIVVNTNRKPDDRK